MSFRENLQHLRATRNMTQEQLAMLLGVSRQSVSKWEAERAYPEMDKLLKLCSFFGCTLDELVMGDLTVRPTDVAASMPTTNIPQDVTGYDQAMRDFAWRLPLGVAIVIAGAALALLLSDPALAWGSDFYRYGAVMVFIGAAVGLALMLPAFFKRKGFRKAHPFVEDFYTVEQKRQARTSLSTGIVAGICFVLAGLAASILLQANTWLAGAVFLLLAAVGVFIIVRGCLLGSRCDLEAYNQKSLYGMDDSQIEALDDEDLQMRARQAKQDKNLYRIVMCLATVVGLVLLFAPVSGFQRVFWLAWPVGLMLCVAIKAFRSIQSHK